MKVTDLLQFLQEQGISLSLDNDGQLVVRATRKIADDVKHLLRDNKAALLDLLSGSQSDDEQVITKAEIDLSGTVPLSMAQQRIWLDSTLYNKSYTIFRTVNFDASLCIKSLEKALRTIINRHAPLRTVYQEVEGAPVGRLLNADDFTLTVVDLSGVSTDERQAQLQRQVTDFAGITFDLGSDFMIKGTLFKVTDDEYLLCGLLHHIATDGESMSVFINELNQCYSAYRYNKPLTLQPLEIDYLDFSAWEQDFYRGPAREKFLNYWMERLYDAPLEHEFPTDRPRNDHDFSGKLHTQKLSASLSGDLSRLARSLNTTLFMLLETAFALTIAKYSGVNDVLVGTAVANRKQKELSSLIGVFLNTIVVRTNFDPAQSFSDLIRQQQPLLLSDLENQSFPFEILVETLNPQRQPGLHPIVQLMFTFDNQERDSIEFQSGGSPQIEHQKTTSNFDISIHAEGNENGITLHWGYSLALFDEATILTVCDNFATLLHNIVAGPDLQMDQLSLMSKVDQQQALKQSPGLQRDFSFACVPTQIFRPERHEQCAVLTEDESLTFAELQALSESVAASLQQAGIKQGDVVVLSANRTTTMVAGVLGIWLAAAVYVPLDPALPDERISFLLDDCNASLVITQEYLVDQLPVTDIPVLSLEQVTATEATYQPVNVTADSPAYVIYTSGSTGMPKGVLVSHGNVAEKLSSMAMRYELTPDDTMLCFASMSFDASISQLFSPLVAGAKAVIRPGDMNEPDELMAYIIQHEISVIHVVPQYLSLLVSGLVSDEAWIACKLRTVISGGDVLDGSLVSQWFERIKDKPVSLYNSYGPTETTITACTWKVENDEGLSRYPIGLPTPNTQCYVVDGHGMLAPVGVPGELWIAGAGVAVKYLNQPALTAERFIPDPFATTDASTGYRLYKSGDKVVRQADGSIMFLGRIDQQVKIRGFRIEPGEIESTMKWCDTVLDAAVITEGEGEECRLHAFVVLSEAGDVALLKDMLLSRLPEYMLPDEFTVIDALPLTISGKVDRKALANLPSHNVNSNIIAPRNEVESRILEIWLGLLPDTEISVTSNFFDSGGHSLLATRLASHIRKGFSVDFSLKSLFEAPSIEEQAALVSAQLNQDDDAEDAAVSSRGEIKPVPRDPAGMPVSFAQQRLWFIDKLMSGSSHYNTPKAFRVEGEFDLVAAEQAVQALIQRHEVLRTVFIEKDDFPVQIIRDEVDYSLEVIDWRDLSSEQQQEKLAANVASQYSEAFDLSHDVMIRMRFIRLADTSGALLFNMHHIATDGWSLGVMLREFTALYRHFSTQQPIDLKPLSVQYADYAHWQRNWLTGEVLDQQLNYWTQHLADLPTVHSLPMKAARPEIQQHKGTQLRRELSTAVSDQLKQLATKLQLTPFMLFQGVLALVVSRHSASSDIVIGTPIANRQDKDIEALIGFFVNTLVLRLDTSSDSVLNYFKHVRQVHVDAQAHQDIPFEQLVEYCAAERSTRHSPLFQIMFNYDSAGSQDEQEQLEIPGLSFSRITGMQTEQTDDNASAVAKFDLDIGVYAGTNKVALSWTYDVALFSDEMMNAMFDHYVQLLQDLATREITEKTQLRDCQMLSSAEIAALLQRPAIVEVADDKPLLHGLIEQQAEQTPNAVAVVFDDNVLTYQQLNQQANQLAHGLIARGVLPGDIVAVCLERSVELVVSLLAIVKAGAAYLPLDTAAPQARLAQIETDSSAKLVLTNDAGIKHFKMGVLVSDVQSDASRSAVITNPEISDLTPEDLAYVIYTSGSTGQPKGVQISHHAIVNRLDWMQREYGLTASDNVLQKTPYTFDVSVWEFFWPLREGASLVLAKPDGHKDPGYLSSLINDAQISVLHFVPSMLNVFMQQTEFAESVRYLFCSGEALETATVETVKQQSPHVAMFNLYGPTEAAIDVSAFACSELFANDSGPFSSGSVPIGKPVQNTSLLVLDNQMNLVPDGAIGELYIGGDNLANGYLGQPALTAERFVQHPFAANETLYRTGDLVRRLADGNLVFTGRADDQVKLHGLRIEPGEIVHQCLACEGITDAVVMVRDERLVAWLVSDADVSEDAMRQQLGQQLPDYMVPSAFVWLDAIPLTTNGKLDRKALPEPGAELSAYVAPETAEQQMLCDVIASVLGLEQVGLNDNFFRLGGHSLLVIKLTSELRQRGYHAELYDVYRASSVAELAAQINLVTAERSIPENLIPVDCNQITPEMVTLATVTDAELACLTAQVPGGAANIQDIYPLGPLQAGMLFHHRMAEGQNDPYVTGSMYEFDSETDARLFLDALQRVVSRHDVLRTAIFWDALSQPLQVVLRDVVLSPVFIETSADSSAKQQLQQLVEPGKQFMDLQQAPGIRLFAAADKESGRYYLAVQLHHIFSDHISLDIFIDDLQAYMDSPNPVLPDASQYRDFVAATLQSDAVQEQSHQSQRSNVFADMLSTVDEACNLFDLTAESTAQNTIEDALVLLDDEQNLAVRKYAKAQGITPAAIFHAAWALVVQQCAGSADAVFGTVFSGRQQQTNAARSVGLYLNTLPINLDVNVSASELIRQAQQRLVGLMSVEQTPLSDAISHSGLRTPAGGQSALFNSVLNYRHQQSQQARQETATQSDKEAASSLSKVRKVAGFERTNYPVSVSVNEAADGFSFAVQVPASIGAQRIGEYYRQAVDGLLNGVQSDEQTGAANQISLLTPTHKNELQALAQGETVEQTPQTLHQAIEQQVAANPDAIAVRLGDAAVSYQALNQQAEALANYLRASGISSHTGQHQQNDQPVNNTSNAIVAVCLPRSIDMVVALLAIVKAGAAWLPLDPQAPAKRLAEIEADADAMCVLTDETSIEHFKAGVLVAQAIEDGETVVKTTADNPNADDQNSDDQNSDNKEPQQLAYVIYTSGSTGKPKGVQVSHQAIVNRLDWMQRQYQLTGQDKVLQKTPYTFDVSVWEFFWPLREGACLVLAKPDGHKDPEYMSTLMHEQQISVVHFVPSMLNVFVQSETFAPSVRYLFCSGEALPVSTVQQVQQQSPELAIHNLYGPTEAAVDVSYFDCAGLEAEAAFTSPDTGIVPIGKPIQNTGLYVLNEHQVAVPFGARGELYIGGQNLAEGYLGRDDLTNERFITCSSGASGLVNSGERLYRTGDIVRWSADGELVYLGRADEQVKLRGLRVEPGEIRHAILATELSDLTISDAAVIVREDNPGDQRLVAYLVSEQPASDDAITALNQSLTDQLPDYMIPVAWVVLERLPLTVNGKLNRAALPAPEMNTGDDYVAPQTPQQQALCEVFATVLKLERFGLNDNFFMAGGHSLLVMKAVAQLRERGWRLTVAQLFTVTDLTALAELMQPVESDAESTPSAVRIPVDCALITPDMLPLVSLTEQAIHRITSSVAGGSQNIQDIYPLAPLQQGLYFHHQTSTEAGDPYVLGSLLRFDDHDSAAHFIDALTVLTDRHDILRTVILSEGLPEPVQVVQRQVSLPVEMIHADSDQALVSAMQALVEPGKQTQDLSKGPVLQLQRGDCSDGQVYLVVKWHHVFMDHLSLDELYREIALINVGEQHRLPEPVSYRDFVANAVQSDDDMAFFADLLANVSEPTLIYDIHQHEFTPGNARRSGLTFTDEIAEHVRDLAKARQISPAVIFHAAWAMVVSQLSGREQVVFGSVLAGRFDGISQRDVRIGLFMNTLPLCLDLTLSSDALLQQTRECLVALMDREHVALADVQASSQLEQGSELFNALFNYRHMGQDDDHDSSGHVAVTGRKKSFRVDEVETREITHYPFAMSVNERPSGFSCVVHTIDTVEPEALCRYLQTALIQLLNDLDAGGDTMAARLNVLCDKEQLRLRSFGEIGQQTYAPTLTTVAQFMAMAAQYPDGIAVVADGREQSYQALDKASNRIAHQLQQAGVMPGDFVGIFAERGFDLPAAMLGILKAGAAYVPLDPAYPASRIEYICQNSAINTVLVDDSIAAEFQPVAADGNIKAVMMQATAHNAALPDDFDVVDRAAMDPAYVIYTSGSTGQPKGVVVPHRAIIRLVINNDFLSLGPETRFMQAASIAFDAATIELWGPLLNGGCAVMYPQRLPDIDRLNQLINEQQVNTLWLTAGLFNQWVESDTQLPSMRHLLAGGDVLSPSAVVQCQQKHPQVQLYNGYGPTENTVFTTVYPIPANWSETDSIPLGQLINGTSGYVINEQNGLAPEGVAGELIVGGDGLALGYQNAPELTAEKFVELSTGGIKAGDKPERFYRTGDLVRIEGDNLVFIGRADQQIKLRGFRIETTEIENTLNQLDAIGQSAVVLQVTETGDKQLVAYVVADPSVEQSDVNEASIRDYLVAQLPGFMVPAAIMLLAELPLTVNGKLDRRALPVPDFSALAEDHQGPSTPQESLLVQRLADVLKRDPNSISVTANFFALGGHSLIAIKLANQLRSYGFELDLTQIFVAQDLAELAKSMVPCQFTFEAVENGIPADATAITPDMLSLIDLTDAELQRVIQQVSGLSSLHADDTQEAENIQDIYPLAPLQQGLYYHYRMAGAKFDPYVLTSMYAFSQQQDLDAFVNAMQYIMDRYDTLRTVIVHDGLSEPVQVVLRRARVTINFVERAENLTPQQQVEQLIAPGEQWLDLACQPGITMEVVTDNAAGKFYVALKCHHIFIDHISFENIHQEVGDFLQRGIVATHEPRQYRHFIAWIQHQATQQPYQEYFRDTLQQVDEPTLPFGLTDVAGSGQHIDKAVLELSEALTTRIREHASAQRTSSAILFHAAWAMVVGWCSDRDDVLFGTVLSGRSFDSDNKTDSVGLFMNTLPLRVNLAQPAAALLHDVEHNLLNVMQYEHAPLYEVKQYSSVPADMPLFSALLNYRHMELPEGEDGAMSQVQIERFGGHERTNYPFMLSVNDYGTRVSFSAQIAEQVGADRVNAYLEQAVTQLLNALDTSQQTPDLACRLPLLPAAESQQLMAVSGSVATVSDVPLQHFFEQQVQQQPDSPALRFGEQTLSYAELNNRAEQLTGYLKQQLDDRAQFVGVFMDRGINMVVSILAVLKAGRTYVPLDPEYPVSRIDFIVEDTGLSHVLTQTSLLSRLNESITGIALDDDAVQQQISLASPITTPVDVAEDSAAYVIYTSGSTGKPKGVVIRHHSAVALMEWAATRFSREELAGVLATTSVCFDLSIFEMFVPLSHGGSIVMVRSILDLVEQNVADGVTLINTVPSAIQALLEQRALPASLITVNLAGELLQQQLVEQLYDAGVQRVYDLYGPSEDTTYTTCSHRQPGGYNNIGRPVSGTQLFVLDQHQRLVPAGCVGELYVAGNGLAAGYLNRDELTAERFVTVSLPGLAPQRMYRTGDLVRLSPDNLFEYLGRLDQQAKVRGMRIEMGEVENRLLQSDVIAEAAVVTKTDAAGSLYMVGYLVAEPNADSSDDGISDQALIARVDAELRVNLPVYMVPGVFIVLDELPLTPNGKVDKKALMALDVTELADSGYVTPTSDTEQTLCAIWGEILSKPAQDISVTANLFALGAHSLSVVRAVAEITKQLSLTISIQAVFVHPDIRALAAHIDEQRDLSSNTGTSTGPGTTQSDNSSMEEIEW